MARIYKVAEDLTTPPPFWQQLPRIFTYPAHEDALLKIAAYGTVAGLVRALPLGFLISTLVWMGFVAYCFGVLERTARGHLLPAQLTSSDRTGRDPRPFQQVVLVIVFVLLVGAAAIWIGPRAAQAALLVASLILPAAIMVLALEESLLAALNPLRIVSTIAGIGLPYLALCVFLFLLLQSSSLLANGLARVLPFWVSAPLANMVSMYFLVSVYYLMGYALYQNHRSLGIDVYVDPATARRALAGQGAEADVLDPETQALIADGNLEEAARRIELRLRRDWDNDKLHDRYHKLLLLLGKPVLLERHVNGYVGKLINEKKHGRAVDIYEAARKSHPELALTGPSLLLPLATQAFELRRDATALHLLDGFDKKFPGHEDTPAVYMLAGRILLERRNQYAQAEQVFRGLVRKFAPHPLEAEANRLAELARKMAAVGHPAA